PRERQVTLDPTNVEVEVQAADDEDDVDVRRDDLRLRLVPRDLPHEGGAPRQDRLDPGAALVGTGGDGDPVAYGRMLVVVAQPAGELRTKLALLRVHDVLASVLDGDTRGRETVGLIRAERVGMRLVPAQGLQVQLDLLLRKSVPGKGR